MRWLRHAHVLLSWVAAKRSSEAEWVALLLLLLLFLLLLLLFLLRRSDLLGLLSTKSELHGLSHTVDHLLLLLSSLVVLEISKALRL